MMGETVAYATVSPHSFIHCHTYKRTECYPPLLLLHSDLGDFNTGLCHVMKISIAESNPDMEFF